MVAVTQTLDFLHPQPVSLRHPQPTTPQMAHFRLDRQIHPH